MKNFKTSSFAFLVLLALIVTSCNKDPMMGSGDLSFRGIIDEGGSTSAPLVSQDIDTASVETNLPIGEGTYNCTTVTYSVNAAGGGDSGFPLFNPNADVIYPGSMLQGNSLNLASPNPISVTRAGGTISTDILDGNLQSFFEVDKVTNSSITDGMNNILSNATGSLPSNFNMRVENIQSREQFALELGVDVETAFTKIESKLGYKSDTEKSSFLVSLNQSYYTMSFDLPTSLDELFAPSVTPEDLAPYVGEGNPATYISSVTYGRIFYMLIESTSSETELGIAIDGAFSGVAVDVDVDLDIDYFSSLENVTYSVFAYGGESSSTFELIGETDLVKLREGLKESSSLFSGKPLSYVVRNVQNNQIVATQLATEYDVVECELISSEGTLPAIAHWTNHPLLDNFGPITAAYANGSNEFVLLNSKGDRLESSVDDQGNGVLEGPFSWGDDLPFTTVGAAGRISGPDGSLYLFNGAGNKYAVLGQSGNWGQIHDITAWFGGDMPFATAGVGAIAYQGYDYERNSEAHRLFEKQGVNHARGYFNSIPPSQGHYPHGVDSGYSFLGNKIDAVGAAAGIVQGNTGVTIFFNTEGDEYVVHGDFGLGYESRGPFSL